MSRLGHSATLLRRAAACAPAIAALPTVDLAEAFPGIDEQSIELRHRFRPRGLPHGEAYVLALIVAHLSPRRIFEIGTGTGEGTLLMARQAPKARIDTLDLGEGMATLGVQRGDEPLGADPVGEAFAGTPEAAQITQHLGDSATFDFGPFEGRMDLVFVDGAHIRRYVAADSRSALRLLRPGGVVVWDDCHLVHAGVGRALLGLRRSGLPVARLAASRLAVLRTPGVLHTTTPSPTTEEVVV